MIATCGPLDGAKQETNLTIHACTLYDFFRCRCYVSPLPFFFRPSLLANDHGLPARALLPAWLRTTSRFEQILFFSMLVR